MLKLDHARVFTRKVRKLTCTEYSAYHHEDFQGVRLRQKSAFKHCMDLVLPTKWKGVHWCYMENVRLRANSPITLTHVQEELEEFGLVTMVLFPALLSSRIQTLFV